MGRHRVQLYGQNRYVVIDDAARSGAVVGRDLRWSDGRLVPENALRAAIDAVLNPVDSGNFPTTYWRLVQEIPPNVTALEETATAGLYVVTGDGTSATRTIRGNDGELVVENGDGIAGNPQLGLAEVEDSGAGALLAIERDAFGRVAGTRPATITGTPGEIDVADGDASAGLPTISLAPLRMPAGETIHGRRVVMAVDGEAFHPLLSERAHAGACVGLARQAAAEGGTTEVRQRGQVTDAGWAWAPGPIFCGDAGVLTQTPPATGWVLTVGRAVGATTIDIDIQLPLIRSE